MCNASTMSYTLNIYIQYTPRDWQNVTSIPLPSFCQDKLSHITAVQLRTVNPSEIAFLIYYQLYARCNL